MFRKRVPEREAVPVEQPMFAAPSVPPTACCCPARPAVRVIMPPTASRAHPVDLWLCGHHYRASLQALLAAGATVEELTVNVADQGQVCHAAAAAQERR